MTEPTRHLEDGRHTPEFVERARRNQQTLAAQLKPQPAPPIMIGGAS
jgi:hypothetical protein